MVVLKSWKNAESTSMKMRRDTKRYVKIKKIYKTMAAKCTNGLMGYDLKIYKIVTILVEKNE